ncbi:MAG TPA: peptidase inhibitor family I36 protein [Friedmanniella sp.]
MRAVFALALVPAIIGVGASSAAAGTANCASTYACWWVDQNYNGMYYGSALNQYAWPEGIANKDDSVHNNGTSGNAIFTYNYGYQIEVMYCVRKGVAVSAIPSDKANRGNSHNWKAADSGCY